MVPNKGFHLQIRSPYGCPSESVNQMATASECSQREGIGERSRWKRGKVVMYMSLFAVVRCHCQIAASSRAPDFVCKAFRESSKDQWAVALKLEGPGKEHQVASKLLPLEYFSLSQHRPFSHSWCFIRPSLMVNFFSLCCVFLPTSWIIKKPQLTTVVSLSRYFRLKFQLPNRTSDHIPLIHRPIAIAYGKPTLAFISFITHLR
jgi:hypothetical protein